MGGKPSPVLFLDFLILRTQVLMQHKNPINSPKNIIHVCRHKARSDYREGSRICLSTPFFHEFSQQVALPGLLV